MLRPLRVLMVLVVLVGGALLASRLGHELPLPRDTQPLSVSLEITDTGIDADGDLPILPELTAVLQSMRSGSARANTDSVSIVGVAATDDGFGDALARLRGRLPDGIETDVDVFVINAGIPTDRLCDRMFAYLSGEYIRFFESGTEMRHAAVPDLDRVAEYLGDCPGQSLRIIGHTDSTGTESWNVRLSRQRASAVADYLANRGIARERLVIDGRGSAEPIADNGTRIGREKNRRIEFELVR